ncbi:ATP-binding protein [Streptomyces sp. NBC_00989]|uniref:ATP-binding protein n=1 Tax=Streptomyces sp. NBC_00989 TaxID=2903705 RepID=UPI003869C50F|nr:ATP-binding protein [Streptomyces sp. NBC_00989]
MSQLRAPAARADRREGGRHGRPAARPVPALPDTHIRPQLLRLAVLPPIAVALSASAAVLFTVRSTGARTSLTLWVVLAGATSVTVAGILIAAVAAGRAAGSVSDRIGALRRSSARGEADLRDLVEALRRGEGPPQRKPRSRPPGDADDFDLLAADLAHAHDGAVTAVVAASQLSSQAGSEQKVEVFVNLARRLQSLVHREISILDELENEIEDPDLLKGLFHVDHLATRIRRHAENLAVLGGAVSRRQWSNPVSMTEVLRSAIAEVEQYSRVKLVPPIDGTLRGHAVADVIHLLAELVENATVFSAPHTQVLLRVNLVTSGLAVEVEDRGLGMPVGEQSRMNALLTDPDQVNVASLLADGRIGLFVVSQLARRHGIHVRLQTNIYGGVQAVIVVPQALLGTAPGAPGVAGRPQDTLGGGHPLAPPQHAPQVGGQAQRGTEAGQLAVGQGESAASGAPVAPGRHQRGAGSPGRHQRRDSVPPGAPSPNGSGPVPLPVRGAHAERANPSEAVPGIRPDDRGTVAENVTAPPVPRGGAVRGTMGKPPQLPRRRAQEHIAPQLRDGPTPRQDSEHPAGHDPGLMAAFQRGIGLAEAQQHMEAAEAADGAVPADGAEVASPHMESDHTESAHTESAHTELAQASVLPMDEVHTGGAYMSALHTEPPLTESSLTEPSRTVPSSIEPSHTEFPHMNGAGTNGVHTGGLYMNALHADPSGLDSNAPEQPSVEQPHMSATHMGSGYMDTALHHYTAQPTTPDTETDAGPGTHTTTDRFTLAPHMGAAPIAEAHAHVLGHDRDLTARHDGSASAG